MEMKLLMNKGLLGAVIILMSTLILKSPNLSAQENDKNTIGDHNYEGVFRSIRSFP